MVGKVRTQRRSSSASSKVALPSLRAVSSLSLMALKMRERLRPVTAAAPAGE